MTPDESHDAQDTRRPEWYAQEELWRASYPFFFTDAKFDQAAADLDALVALAQPPGRTALDLCCGPGRFAVPLAERGFRVTALDRTPFLIGKAQARAHAATVDIDWARDDMRNFVRTGAFDLVLSMFTSFGYFEDKADDDRVLQNVLESLRPGGVFLVEVFGKELIAARFEETGTLRLDNGSVLFEERTVVDDWTRIHNEWTLVSNGQVRRFDFTLRVYSGCELRQSMEHAGFVNVTLYGDVQGSPYDRNASRLVAVGRRDR